MPLDGDGEWGAILCGGGLKVAFTGGTTGCLWRKKLLRHIRSWIGISGGAAVATYVLADQIPEGQEILTEHIAQGLVQRRWPVLNLQFLTEEVFQRRVPLKLDQLRAAIPKFEIVITDCTEGRPVYVDGKNGHPFDAVWSSCSLFPSCPPHPYNGHLSFDGGFTDPIPIARMIEGGVKKILVIMTNPVYERATPVPWALRKIAEWFLPPAAARAYRLAPSRYNDALTILRSPPDGVKIVVVAPKQPLPVGTLSANREQLRATMQMGYDAMQAAIDSGQFP